MIPAEMKKQCSERMATINAMMDILNTTGFSREAIDRLIDATETLHLSLKLDNERIRALATQDDVVQAIAAESVNIDAALISSCRSDMLSCGRCAFWIAMRKHGVKTANVK